MLTLVFTNMLYPFHIFHVLIYPCIPETLHSWSSMELYWTKFPTFSQYFRTRGYIDYKSSPHAPSCAYTYCSSFHKRRTLFPYLWICQVHDLLCQSMWQHALHCPFITSASRDCSFLFSWNPSMGIRASPGCLLEDERAHGAHLTLVSSCPPCYLSIESPTDYCPT
jgi:hypothetical protein